MLRLPLFALLFILAAALAASAVTWDVKQDGSGDATQVQAGIDLAASGDTVRVYPGIYSPSINGESFPIEMKGAITLVGYSPEAQEAIIDAEGTARVITCLDLGSQSVIEGLVITGGHAGHTTTDVGGGIYCANSTLVVSACRMVSNQSYGGGGIYANSSSLIVMDCEISGNSADDHAGGIFCVSAATIDGCEVFGNTARTGGGIYCAGGFHQGIWHSAIWGNSAQDYGGGVRVNSGALTRIVSCTIVGNRAPSGGGGVSVRNPGSSASIEKAIIAFSAQGHGVQCDMGGTATIRCSNVYGNPAGDWVSCIAGYDGLDGNFSADPLFCDLDNSDFHLWADSPCAPGNHPDGWDCGLIGAFAVACGLPVPAIVDIDPSVLNPESQGRWLTCHICLAEGYDPADIDVATIVLNGEVQAEARPTALHDGCLMVKFDRAEVVATVGCGEDVVITVSGDVAGESFSGMDIIRVLCKGPTVPLASPGSESNVGFRLQRIHPNPFVQSTTVSFGLSEARYMKITVHDVRGRLVRTLVEETRQAGSHSVEWDARDESGRCLDAGIYFLRTETADGVAKSKLVLVH